MWDRTCRSFDFVQRYVYQGLVAVWVASLRACRCSRWWGEAGTAATSGGRLGGLQVMME